MASWKTGGYGADYAPTVKKLNNIPADFLGPVHARLLYPWQEQGLRQKDQQRANSRCLSSK